MKNIKRLINVLEQWKWQYLIAGILITISSIFRMLSPKILQITIDGVVIFFLNNGKAALHESDIVAAFFYNLLPTITTKNLVTVLLYISIMLLIISVFRVATQFVSGIIAAAATEKSIRNLRNRLFLHIQKLPISWVNQKSTGALIQRSTGDVETVKTFLSKQTIELVMFSAVFLGALTMMLAIHWQYALWSVFLGPVNLFLAVYFFKKEGKIWQEHEAEQDKLTKIAQENLSGIRVVQAFARENFEIEKFKTQNQTKLKVALKHVDLHKNYWTIADSLINTQIVISVFVGGFYVLNQVITIGEFASFFSYTLLVAWPMRQVGQIVSQMGMATVAMERIAEILDAKTEDYSGEIPEQQKLQGKIEFKNVSFKYHKNDKKWALQNINFSIEAGENIALMGKTGAGKSTIIALLSRLYEPTLGEIFLDDKPLSVYDKTFLRNQIGVVHQQPFLFSTTIHGNMIFANKDTTELEQKEAVKSAQIDTFIHKMTNGYETLVGEKGVTLSGGQKQRIALARTLLSKPDILVLDDSTSAVDTETEAKIQQALKQHAANKTTIFIAHRLSSVQHATKIIVLDDGEIVQIGTAKSLLLEKGYYRQVFDIQQVV
jgi:ATP-binding cassette subfamily B protein